MFLFRQYVTQTKHQCSFTNCIFEHKITQVLVKCTLPVQAYVGEMCLYILNLAECWNMSNDFEIRTGLWFSFEMENKTVEMKKNICSGET